MKCMIIFQIIFIIILIFLVIKLSKISRSIKYNERLSKYTINNNHNERLSIGDKLLNIYYSLRKSIVKFLKKSHYFKTRATKYERYVHKLENNAINIIATKVCFSLLFGLIYIISALHHSKFEFIVLIFYMLVGYFIYNIYLIINEKRRNKLIEDDLLKAIIIMNNAFKSGYNITQATTIVAKDLTGPISEEFERIGNDLKYGLELKDVFDRFYGRVKLDDAKYITTSLNLLNLTGGNLVGIFTSIEKSFTNKKRLRDELNSMTSSSKLVFYILLFMPVFLIGFLLVLSPDYFNPLVTNPIGILMCFLAISLYIGYIIIIRKILKVEA